MNIHRFIDEHGSTALNAIKDANIFLVNMQMTSIYNLYHTCYYDADHLANNAYTRTSIIPKDHEDIMIRLKKYIDDNINTNTDSNDDSNDDNITSPVKRQRHDRILSPFSQSKEHTERINHQYYDLWNLYEIAQLKSSLLE